MLEMIFEVFCIAVVSIAWTRIITVETPVFKELSALALEWNSEEVWKALFGCHKCFAGQLALWYFILKHHEVYSFPAHVVFTCGSILSAVVLNKIINE